MSEGEIIRLKIIPETHIKVSAGSEIRDSRFTSVPFKDGRAIKSPSMFTSGRGASFTLKQTPDQADEIIVRIRKGSMQISVEAIEAPTGIILTKAHLKSMSGKEFHPDPNKKFLLRLTDNAADNKAARGEMRFYEGSAQHKKLLTKFNIDIKNGETKVREFPSDQKIGTIDINILDSSVDVRIEQPEVAGTTPAAWGRLPAGTDQPVNSTAPQAPDILQPAQSKPGASNITRTATIKSGSTNFPPVPDILKQNSTPPVKPETTQFPPVPTITSQTPAHFRTSVQGLTAATGQTANMVFILDASGSMWGRIDDVAKIEIAKQVMTGIIQNLSTESNVGLVAYGHRRKGDCTDVEELAPIAPLQKDLLIEKISNIKPKGMTPITFSIKTTAQKLKSAEQETTIILVSDGQETCNADPCALVRQLKESGLKFVMHVIGFDVTDAERVQLECVARAGGGAYYTAKNAEEFQVAAQKVVKEAENFGQLKIIATRNNIPIRVDLRISKLNSDQSILRTSAGTDKSDAGVRLQPGVYNIQVIDKKTVTAPVKSIADIEIRSGETTERHVEFSGGTIEISAIKHGKLIKAYLWISQTGSSDSLVNRWMPDNGPAVFSLLPGLYDIRVQDNSVADKPEQTVSGIEIKNGAKLTKQIEFVTEGVMEVTAFKNNRQFQAYARVGKNNEDTSLVSGWMPKDGPASYKLLPGIYHVVLEDSSLPGKPRVEIKDIEVKSGRTVTRNADFVQEGVMEVTAFKNNRQFQAYARVGKNNEDTSLVSGWMPKDGPVSYKLLPGIYHVVLEDNKTKVKKESGAIQIESGQTRKVEIVF